MNCQWKNLILWRVFVWLSCFQWLHNNWSKLATLQTINPFKMRFMKNKSWIYFQYFDENLFHNSQSRENTILNFHISWSERGKSFLESNLYLWRQWSLIIWITQLKPTISCYQISSLLLLSQFFPSNYAMLAADGWWEAVVGVAHGVKMSTGHSGVTSVEMMEQWH